MTGISVFLVSVENGAGVKKMTNIRYVYNADGNGWIYPKKTFDKMIKIKKNSLKRIIRDQTFSVCTTRTAMGGST